MIIFFTFTVVFVMIMVWIILGVIWYIEYDDIDIRFTQFTGFTIFKGGLIWWIAWLVDWCYETKMFNNIFKFNPKFKKSP